MENRKMYLVCLTADGIGDEQIFLTYNKEEAKEVENILWKDNEWSSYIVRVDEIKPQFTDIEKFKKYMKEG